MTKALRTLTMLGLVAMIAGCYESADVTEFEPGVYKGQSDPLLNADTGARADALQERFMTIQTDR